MKIPYLIQRGTINTEEIGLTERLSNAVGFQYMGSAEFEFGALPASFRRISDVFENWNCRTVPEIKDGDQPLQVWSSLTDDEFAVYVTYLARLRNPKNVKDRSRTKEATRFESHRTIDLYFKTDFWWDIENDVMFGFSENFMPRVKDHVKASLDYMHSQHSDRRQFTIR